MSIYQDAYRKYRKPYHRSYTVIMPNGERVPITVYLHVVMAAKGFYRWYDTKEYPFGQSTRKSDNWQKTNIEELTRLSSAQKTAYSDILSATVKRLSRELRDAQEQNTLDGVYEQMRGFTAQFEYAQKHNPEYADAEKYVGEPDDDTE